MDLSIVIINYNTTSHLIRCINSFAKSAYCADHEIIVVDNSSPERDIEKLPSQYAGVKFFFRNINDGFSGGCNYGASKSSGKYLMFLNPDTEITPDVISSMIEFMEKNNTTGACSPSFVNYEDNFLYTYNKFPNINWEFFEVMGSGNDKTVNELNNVIVDYSRRKEPLIVDWVTGACLMIRSDLFRSLGGFDEDYFLYYEDTDIEKRITNSGYRISLLTYLKVRHFVNSSVKSQKGNDIYYFHLNRSKMLYFYKHFGIVKRNVLRTLWIAGTLARMAALFLRIRYKEQRQQKWKQYERMLAIFTSSKSKILKLTI